MMFSPILAFAADTIAITGQRATPSYWTKHTINGDKVLLAQQEISTLNRTMREKSKTLVDLAAYNIHQSAAHSRQLL